MSHDHPASIRLVNAIVGDETQYIRGKLAAYGDVSPNLRWRCIASSANPLRCVAIQGDNSQEILPCMAMALRSSGDDSLDIRGHSVGGQGGLYDNYKCVTTFFIVPMLHTLATEVPNESL